MEDWHPIGVFDSGYGGLTVLRAIEGLLPAYDYLYLGDNARAPYGNRSFDTVYHDTLQCVRHLIEAGCRLVILACNTASAKALRTIQQRDIPGIVPFVRVLGVIRPTAEIAGNYSQSGHIGIFATSGTVSSGSYLLEIERFFPGLIVAQEACPMWVPLVETGEYGGPGADYFIKKHVDRLMGRSPNTDAIILGCTHYPLLLPKIIQAIPDGVKLISQDEIVAKSLADYLVRHPEIETLCTRNGTRKFLTTDDAAIFERQAAVFYGRELTAKEVSPA
jgi:glutamate racemase